MSKSHPKNTYFAAAFVAGVAIIAFFQGCAGIPSSLSSDTPGPVSHPIANPPTPQVLTYHNDNARTGLNPNETVLTPANVNAAQFGKLFSYPIDGYAAAEPLHLANVNVPGLGTLNVVFVATEHDSVYAFDAAGKVTGALWHRSFIDPAHGITTVPQADVGSTIFPEIGITSTPVIDPDSGTLYVEALTKENGVYVQRLHALDVTTGGEKFGGPVTISGSVPGRGEASSGGTLSFNPKLHLQRSGLLLANGKIYVAFASHGDNGPYHGWIMAYDAKSLAQVGIWCTTPDGNDGGIWMSSGGLSADSGGAIYGASSNGSFNADSGGHEYADTVFKLAGDLSNVIDYFTPFDQQQFAAIDEDMGTSNVLLLPDQPGAHPHLAIVLNKNGSIYVVDRDNMGHYHTADNAQIVQFMLNAVGNGTEDRSFTSPAFWNNYVFFGGAFDHLKAYQVVNGQLTPASKSGNVFGFQGSTPVISANGTSGAIVWAIDRVNGGMLHAYDATDLSKELWNSLQNSGRDNLGASVAHFAVPTVVNGRIYVATQSTLVAYGLLQ